MTSDKKIDANRENGRKGKGPTSTEGKAWSRRNALKSGLFSRLLVVAAAGEKQEDFDAILSGAREQFPPQDFVIGFLGGDLAKTIWELQRLSQYQTAEIRKQCDTGLCRRRLEKMAEVDSLKERFLRDLAGLCMNAPLPADRAGFSASLENTRRQLEQTSTGIEFLLENIEATQRELERAGYLSPPIQELLINSCGMGDVHVKYVLSLNQIAKTEMEKLANDEEAGKATLEQNKSYLLDTLKSKIQTMRELKNIVEDLETAEEKAYLTSLVMPPAEVLEKISRVDARLRRNLYKTLDILIGVVYGNDR